MTTSKVPQNLIDMAIADEGADTADEEEELSALSRVVVPQKADRRTHTQISYHSLILADSKTASISTGKGLNAEADACKHTFVEQRSQVPGAMAASACPSSSSLL